MRQLDVSIGKDELSFIKCLVRVHDYGANEVLDILESPQDFQEAFAAWRESDTIYDDDDWRSVFPDDETYVAYCAWSLTSLRKQSPIDRVESAKRFIRIAQRCSLCNLLKMPEQLNEHDKCSRCEKSYPTHPRERYSIGHCGVEQISGPRKGEIQ